MSSKRRRPEHAPLPAGSACSSQAGAGVVQDSAETVPAATAMWEAAVAAVSGGFRRWLLQQGGELLDTLSCL